jgi:hypothetical protein
MAIAPPNVSMRTTAWALSAMLALVGIQSCGYQGESFVAHHFPMKEMSRIFDVGIVDANGDGLLDVYTSNHHFRQALLVADGNGGYRDVLSEWGLDQSREFPLAELSYSAPALDRPGVYVYWLGTKLIVRSHRGDTLGSWRGSMHTFDPVKVVRNEGGQVDKEERTVGAVTETRLQFGLGPDGLLVMTPGGQGLPIDFDFGDMLRPEQIFVGRGAVSPSETRFSLAMQDRHGHAWADFNDDGTLDLFVSRGALSGTLLAQSPSVIEKVKDELLLSQGPGRFMDASTESGVRKKGCSGRHVKWLDFNKDGLLDLFVNCYDRENVAGDFPKQLYEQTERGILVDRAEDVGIGLADQQIGSLAWLDVDNDGDVDLLAFQDEGLFLYRSQDGKYPREQIVRVASSPREGIGRSTASAALFDGNLSVSDFDADGDLDAFCSSKRGDTLLRNSGGSFEVVELSSVGLPAYSLAANWVDYDNDGRPDLHLVPHGLYRQRGDATFESTGILAFDPAKYEAAIVNWFDLDNDGRLDVLFALDRNPEFKRWWHIGVAAERRRGWEILAFRNIGVTGHWLQVDVAGASGNRQSIGARVIVMTPTGRQMQEIGSSEGAFFSQGHYRLYFGLGRHPLADTIEVQWSDGSRRQLKNVPADRLIRVGHSVVGSP